MSQKLVPMSLRLSREMNQRLEQAARDVKQKKHTLAQLAIEAAVEAIESAGGAIVIPVKFDVASIPAPKKIPDAATEPLELRKPAPPTVRYPAHQSQHSFTEDKPPKKKPAA